MARYEHLLIFADAYRLALLVEQLVAELSNWTRPAPWFVDQQVADHARCQPQLGRLVVPRQRQRVSSSQDTAAIGSLPLYPFTSMQTSELVGSEKCNWGAKAKPLPADFSKDLSERDGTGFARLGGREAAGRVGLLARHYRSPQS
jgi:hypothetical protein